MVSSNQWWPVASQVTYFHPSCISCAGNRSPAAAPHYSQADARALWSGKARSRPHSAPATPTATEGRLPGKQAQWSGRTQGSWWLHALASSMAAPN